MDKNEAHNNEKLLKHELRILRELFDGIDEPIYVSDPETYEVLFANKKLKELAGEKILGKKCYKVFHNLNHPCPSCTNEYIFGENLGKTYVWEYQNRRNKHWYKCVDKAIEWLGDKHVRFGMAIDITERKRAEEKLRSAKQEKGIILDNLMEHVIHEDTTMKILWANQAACESAGLTREELVGRYCYEVWQKRSTPCPDCAIIKAMETREPQKVEKRTPDGRYWFIRGYPVLDANGDVVGGIEVTLEMTKRKRAEEALRESEELFRSVVENSHVGILIIDDGFRITYANDEIERIGGHPKAKIIGQDFRKFLGKEEKLLAESLYLRRQNGEKAPSSYEFSITREDGEKRDIEVKSTTIRDSLGRVRTVVQIIDITERKKSEERIRESEEKYRTLFQNARDVILTSNLKGTVTSINRAIAEYGFTEDEAIGKSLFKFVSKKHWPRILKDLGKIAHGSPIEGEIEINTPKGKKIAEYRSNPIKRGNKVVGLQTILRDITERKRFDERLSALNKHGQSLNIADDIQKVLTLTLDVMEKTLGFEFADVFLVERKMLSLVAHRGSSKSLVLNLPLDGRKGVVVKAARLRKPVFVPDIRKERAYVDAGVEGMVSELAVPVKIKGKVLGVLNVESRRLEAFDEKDEELLETLASHAAIAISNLKRQEKLSALNVYGRSLNSAESLEDIYKVTLKAMEKTLGFEYASILMVEGKMLRLVSQRGYSKSLSLDLPLFEERGVTVKAARTRKPILIPDIRKEKSYVLGKPNMLSELAVPIQVEKEVLGVLNVESRKLAGFDEEDRELLEILASHAAIAINDTKRHTQLRKLSNKLANLMESSTEIMRIKDTHQRLKVIAKAIRKFGWRRVVISLRDENLEGTTLVTAGLTKKESKLLLERKAPGHVWRERLGPKFEQFKIGEFYYLRWSDPWIREYVHGIPPEAPLDEANTYAGVPSRLSPEEMVDWHPQDMLYAPLCTPEGRIVGILSMDDPLDGQEPTKESLTPLELFLHQAAIVIENAQLIESLRAARKQLEAYAEQLEQKVEERTRELKKSQEQLLKAQRLAVIGEVAGMVGHDLRNPLTSINGATYYVKRRLSSKIEGKVKEMLDLIEKNVVYSNKIINDLLDYSGEVKLDLTESNPKSIIKEALSLVEIPKNVQIIDLTENKPKIKADIGKIKRAFVNMIKNAVEAMPKGGTLTTKSRKLDGNLEFFFSDTGVGLSKRTMEKLWTPLFTTKAKGMGFGLAICKRIIEAHGGSISAKSAPRKGTTFTVTIPIEQKLEGGEKIWVKPLESSLLTTMKT